MKSLEELIHILEAILQKVLNPMRHFVFNCFYKHPGIAKKTVKLSKVAGSNRKLHFLPADIILIKCDSKKRWRSDSLMNFWQSKPVPTSPFLGGHLREKNSMFGRKVIQNGSGLNEELNTWSKAISYTISIMEKGKTHHFKNLGGINLLEDFSSLKRDP